MDLREYRIQGFDQCLHVTSCGVSRFHFGGLHFHAYHENAISTTFIECLQCTIDRYH